MPSFFTHPCSSSVQVAQGLKMQFLWVPVGRRLPPLYQQWADDGTLCRLFLTLGTGMLEPFCVFTGILLCRGILR